MRKSAIRMAGFMAASLSMLAVPAPSAAQEYEELRECFANCYQAYVVMTQQPVFYDQCRRRCVEWYGDGAAPPAAEPASAVLRYN